MVDLTSLIRDLGAAKEGSRELDMRIGKALGRMPADAEWGNGDDQNWLPPEIREAHLRFTEEWITPAYKAYRHALREFVASRPTIEEFARWEKKHGIGVPTSAEMCPAGSVRRYTRSVDAALTLVPARGDDGLLWRIFLEQKPLHSGPSWIAIVREHAKDGGDAIGYTAPLAICTAALKARSASREARPEKTAEAAAVDTPKTGAANV